MIRPLRFWYPKRWAGPVRAPEIVTVEQVESIVLQALGHEAGHLIAAHHYSARIYGVAIEFKTDPGHEGEKVIEALYKLGGDSIDDFCVITAAGPAADLLYKEGFDDQSASGDLREIERVTGNRSLEPYLSRARELLVGYPDQFTRIVNALRDRIENVQDYKLKVLPGGERIGAFLLNRTQSLRCLSVSVRNWDGGDLSVQS